MLPILGVRWVFGEYIAKLDARRCVGGAVESATRIISTVRLRWRESKIAYRRLSVGNRLEVLRVWIPVADSSVYRASADRDTGRGYRYRRAAKRKKDHDRN
jgi:hypothetical protein